MPRIAHDRVEAYGLRFSVNEEGKEVGRATLFVLHNDLHQEPFGFVEDVFVEEDCRGKGLGQSLMETLLANAREIGCYKVVLCTRKETTARWYEAMGFKRHGLELRMDTKTAG